jgi:uncharacterized protein YjbI with pentapeptide repeats
VTSVRERLEAHAEACREATAAGHSRPDWAGGHLRDAELCQANLRGANLRGADLRFANLLGANLLGVDLRGANLRGADLRGADLRGADLRDADLCQANLRGANLRGANLRGASLRFADLREADLREADLRFADLRDASLRHADLGDANLHRADLRGANLRGANLGHADLGDADLGGAAGADEVPRAPVAGLAAAVLRQITEHPETWDQEVWHSDCGTAHCCAGWAVVLAGGAGPRAEARLGTGAAAALLLGGVRHPFGEADRERVIPWLQARVAEEAEQ